MGIGIVPEGGKGRPAVFCDHCGSRIEAAAEGLWAWPTLDPSDRDPVDVVFLHAA